MVRRFLAPLLALPAIPAQAHVGHGMEGALGSGFVHPFLGTDHLLAIVTVGLLAASQRRRALLVLPGAFVGAMALGLALGGAGIRPPLLEGMIVASVVVLGAMLALRLRPRLALGAGLAGLFGLFHGAAHGLEAGGAALLPFAAGMLAATALLQAGGLALARSLLAGLGRSLASLPLRMLGVGLSLGGLLLAFAP